MLFKLLFGRTLLNLLERMAEPDRPPGAARDAHSAPDSMAGCAAATPPPLFYPRLQRRAMGCLFEIYLAGPDRDKLIAAGEEALDQVERLEDQLSHYRSDSDVARLNANASEQWVRLEPRMYALVRRCLELSCETDGAFDITAGPLVKAWGFYRGQGRVPSNEELAEVMERTGFYRVLTDDQENMIHFSTPGMEINLGAVGKGYAIDEAADMLRLWGAKCAVIHGGQSTIYAVGVPPGDGLRTPDGGSDQSSVISHQSSVISHQSSAFSDQLSVNSELFGAHDLNRQHSTLNTPQHSGWRFVIRDPRDRETALQTVYLRDEALSTSGNYEQFFEHEGVRYSHIIDPVTGRPTQGMISVSVIAASAAESDALSTAFFVLGSEATEEYCRTRPNIRVVMVEDASDGEITVSRIGFSDS